MAISIEDIVRAADALLERGDKPTLALVRKEVGGGSFTKISEGLAAWRHRRQAAQLAQRVPIPEAILTDSQSLLSQMWDAAQEAAQARLETERQALAEAQARLEAETREAVQMADDLAEELDQIRTSLAATQSSLDLEKKAHGTTVEKLRETQEGLRAERDLTTRLREDLDRLTGERDEAAEQVQTLERELRKERERTERVREALSEARERLARVEVERDQALVQLTDLREELKEEREKAEGTREALAQMREKLALAESERERVSRQIAGLEQEQRAERERHREELAQLRAELQAEQGLRIGAERERATALATVAQMEERLTTYEDLKWIRDALESLQPKSEVRKEPGEE